MFKKILNLFKKHFIVKNVEIAVKDINTNIKNIEPIEILKSIAQPITIDDDVFCDVNYKKSLYKDFESIKKEYTDILNTYNPNKVNRLEKLGFKNSIETKNKEKYHTIHNKYNKINKLVSTYEYYENLGYYLIPANKCKNISDIKDFEGSIDNDILNEISEFDNTLLNNTYSFKVLKDIFNNNDYRLEEFYIYYFNKILVKNRYYANSYEYYYMNFLDIHREYLQTHNIEKFIKRIENEFLIVLIKSAEYYRDLHSLKYINYNMMVDVFDDILPNKENIVSILQEYKKEHYNELDINLEYINKFYSNENNNDIDVRFMNCLYNYKIIKNRNRYYFDKQFILADLNVCNELFYIKICKYI